MRLVAHNARIRPLAADQHATILSQLEGRDADGIVGAIRQHNVQILSEYTRVLDGMPGT
jgi:DNA-binding GntR family transcriptional regulator